MGRAVIFALLLLLAAQVLNGLGDEISSGLVEGDDSLVEISPDLFEGDLDLTKD